MTEPMQSGPLDRPPAAGVRHYAGEPVLTDGRPPKAVLLPVPYDGTSTWGKGADKGPEALFEALENMELFDIETGCEVHAEGIAVLEALPLELDGVAKTPEEVCADVRREVGEWLGKGILPVLVGGEHSISIGAIQACAASEPGLSVLQLDAHSDLRSTFHGSACNHACALHWAATHTRLVQVGIRSTEAEERHYEQEGNVFHGSHCHATPDMEWITAAVERLGPADTPVYITVDLDVFDPAHLPETGTPEPGGLNWYQVTGLIRAAAQRHRVIGFDVVELAPRIERSPSAFTAAKLLHKMLTYVLEPEPIAAPPRN